jgi:hypothetical protein
MGVSEAIAVAAAKGTLLRPTDHAPGGFTIYETDEAEPLLLGFCGDRLFDYSRSRGTAAETFIALVHEATINFGPAHLLTRVQETNRGRLHTVAVSWDRDGASYTIELHAMGGDSQVIEQWDARARVCGR